MAKILEQEMNETVCIPLLVLLYLRVAHIPPSPTSVATTKDTIVRMSLLETNIDNGQ